MNNFETKNEQYFKKFSNFTSVKLKCSIIISYILLYNFLYYYNKTSLYNIFYLGVYIFSHFYIQHCFSLNNKEAIKLYYLFHVVYFILTICVDHDIPEFFNRELREFNEVILGFILFYTSTSVITYIIVIYKLIRYYLSKEKEKVLICWGIYIYKNDKQCSKQILFYD